MSRPVADQDTQLWRDPSRPAAERVADLLGRMTLAEKAAQLTSLWLGRQPQDSNVAPMQGEFRAPEAPFAELIQDGLGQLTRVFGTRPVPPEDAARTLRELQAQIVTASRFGIPAVAHEECLTGFAAWTATIFPTPLAWGASFDPGLVGEMAAAIGVSMRAVGVHQGLSPVLDVTRDARWGRVEETIGEDPYLVGSVGTAYVRGLQSAGVQATLKHFAGYSASRAARNLAPVAVGRREFADVILVPFEMAIRGGARSVMPSYTDIDGVPVSGDRELLTALLRDELGFDGLVVSDYYAIAFLQTQHAVAATPAQAAAMALEAGLDVELPSVVCYGSALVSAVQDGRVPVELVDRAATRVLRQKCDLGLLDEDWPGLDADGAAGPAGEVIDLDPPGHRALARRLAEESVVLLANGGPALPLRPEASIAVVGPLADDPLAFFGCYSMPRHLSGRYPEAAEGPAAATVLASLRAELPATTISYAPGCAVRDPDRSGFAHAAAHAREADVVVAVLGDEAGLFGRGTSGEGCDVADLRLPGVQEDLLRVLLAAGTPVVLVLVTGRPYAIGPVAGQLAAAVQAFFPGEEGGGAIAGVLSGRVMPSGRLPVEMPGSAGAQPSSYLRPRLAARHPGSSVDPTPLFAFGHGLSYTSFAYSDLVIAPADYGGGPGEIATDGTVVISCTVRNTGDRAGTEVVQLYLSDPVAQVVRPLRWLAGFARVPLDPGQARRVTFRLHADRTAFSGRTGTRVVEAGEIGVAVGGASDQLPLQGAFTLTGPDRIAGADRVLDTPVVVRLVPDSVTHAHGRLHLGQRDRCDLVGPLVAVPQYLPHVAGVPLVFGAAGPDRGEQVVDGGDDEVLEHGGPARADVRRHLPRVTAQAQGGQQDQVRDCGAADRVVADVPLGVGLRAADEPGGLVGGGRQRDGVAAALAHLGAVGAEQQRRGRQQRVRDRKHRQAEPVVEPARDHPGDLQVRQLVLPHRHQVRLAEQDVRRLVHRIGEHQAADRRLPGVRDLVLDRRVAVQLGHRDQAEERQQQLVERGHRAVREHHRPRRVEPDGQVVEQQPGHVLIQALGHLPVGQHLVVGDHHEDLRAEVLEPDPVPQGAEIMAHVQAAGRPVAGQDAEGGRVLVDQFLEFGRTPVGDGRGHGFRPPLVRVDERTKKAVHPGRPC